MPRLTYANVTASLALFLALGGGAVYAADKIGKESITSKHIAEDSVGRSEVKESAAIHTSVDAHEVEFSVGANAMHSEVADCDPGEVATGGGWQHVPRSGFQEGTTKLDQDGPLVAQGVPRGWRVVLHNEAATQQDYIVYAVCAPGPDSDG